MKFKQKAAGSLFLEYVKRISQWFPCHVSALVAAPAKKESGTQIWVCHRSVDSKSKPLSSEAVARHLQRLLNSGVRELQVLIGGPDGFSPDDLRQWNPDLIWSFGPLTFPHELAAVVASEQTYRALSILKNLPYHSGH